MIFITQGRYTEPAMAGMLTSTDERMPGLEDLLRAAGVKLIGSYWTFGEYDFLVIAEAPDEQAWMKVLLVAAGSGGLTNLKTTLALSTADGDKAYDAARKLVASFHQASG